MKKVIPAVIVLVAIAAVAFVFFRKAVVHHVPATELVPAETIFFANFPDLRRTAERWPKTALAQIGEEPEVKAFLAKPRAAVPQMKLWDEKIAQLERVEPGEAFVAVTSIEGNNPRFLAGVSFSGRKADVDALLAESRATLKSTYPAGKSDVTLQGRTEIETFTYEDKVVGEAFIDDWYFVSNDMELLRKTIDAAPHGLSEKSLGASDLYRKSTARLPADGEVVLFAQVASLTDRLVSLLVAAGQAPDAEQTAELKKIQAVAWGKKFEDALMRDTLFLLSSGNAVEPPLAQHALAFSNADTFLTYAKALPAKVDLPDQSLGVIRTMVQGFAPFESALAAKGLKLNDIGKAFGPELGAVSNWAPGAAQPSILFAVDVRDAAKAKGFVEAFTGSSAWSREEKDGATVYQSPPAAGIVPIAPTMALTDHFLVVGFSQPDVLAGMGQLKAGKAVIAATPAFAEASKAVGTPTSGFAYLDLKTFFERSYGTMRPSLAMLLAFMPDSGKYVDAGKLPNTEAISKHLSPAAYSQAVSVDGTLIESVGPLSFNDVFAAVIGGTVAYSFPMLESAISGGLKIDPSLLQVPAPAAAPPANAPPPASPQPPVPADPTAKPADSATSPPKTPQL